MKIILIAVLMAVASTAWAGNPNTPNPPPFENGGSQEQNQGQAQGQLQGQAQGQWTINENTVIGVTTSSSDSQSHSDSSSSSNANNSLSNVGNSAVRIEGDDFPASSAHSPSINPTSPCMGSSSAGGQGMSFGVSVGSSWRDKECEKREAFRMGFESGHPDLMGMAVEVYKSLDVVQEAMTEEQAAAEPGSNYVAGAPIPSVR